MIRERLCGSNGIRIQVPAILKRGLSSI